MAFSIVLSAASAMTVGLAASHRQADDSDRVAMDLGGVCSLAVDQITCWKPSGEPDRKLSEYVSAYFLVNTQNTLQLRYKSKTLLVVFRQNGDNPYYAQVEDLKINGASERSYNTVTLRQGGNGSDWLTAEWYYPPEGLNSADITASYRTNGRTAGVVLKEGATTMVQGATFKILKIEKTTITDNAPGYGFGGGIRDMSTVKDRPHTRPGWKITYQFTGAGEPGVALSSPLFYDKSGQMVRQVNAKGEPVPQSNDPKLQVYGSQVIGGTDFWTVPVNPDLVGTMDIQWTVIHPLKFPGVALVPRP